MHKMKIPQVFTLIRNMTDAAKLMFFHMCNQ